MNNLLFYIILFIITISVKAYAKESSITEVINPSNSQLSIKSQELPEQKIDTQSLENKELKVLQPTNQAKIIVLNKITAKSKELLFLLGKIQFFGNLSIEVHKCIKNTSPFDNYNLMLLTIFDNKLNDNKVLVFHGWMVSRYPSLSTMEHPVYEVIPIDCLNKSH